MRAPADGTPATGTRYYVHGGETVALRDAGGVRYLISDHHGTDEMRIDASTLAVTSAAATRSAIRAARQPSWPGRTASSAGFEDPTGLTHLGAREYDLAIGRFVSVDPIIDVNDPQQINGYAYANSSPVTLSDPDGLLVSCSGPDGIGCGHPASWQGYGSPEAPAYKRERERWIVSQRKANSWRPKIGPVQGPRPLCNGSGRCLPRSAFPSLPVCKLAVTRLDCSLQEQAADEKRRHQEAQVAARRVAEAKVAADRGAVKRWILNHIHPFNWATRGDCTGVDGAFGLIVVGFSECSVSDGTNTRRTRSVKLGVGPRSPLVVQPWKAAVLSEAPIQGSGSHWGWFLDGSVFHKDVSIGQSFAGHFGPRYLSGGAHIGGGWTPSFASGVRFSW